MAQELLNENVQDIIITPFLKLELLPTGHPNWGLVTNNNFIRVENALQFYAEQVAVVRGSVDSLSPSFNRQLRDVQSMIENETMARIGADTTLQNQILRARFSSRTMSASVSSTFIHNLGRFPSVSIIKEIGVGSGVDVTNAFDTFIIHTDINQIDLTVGVNGNYTVICVA